MQPIPTSLEISDDEWDDLSIDDRIVESMAAGNSISWDAVKRWMLSLGTDKPLPPPEAGD